MVAASRTGIAQAVGQQVGRTHLVHELLVDDPAAAIVEIFGLQQKPVGGRRRIRRFAPADKDAAQDSKQKERNMAFHGFFPRGDSEWPCMISVVYTVLGDDFQT